MTALELSTEVDNSSQSIGRRYARTDEVGIPFGITIDFETLEDKSVTVREENSMLQVRVPITEVAELVRGLVNSRETFEEVRERYPHFSASEV